MKNNFFILFAGMMVFTSCQFFKGNEHEISIPEGLTEEQLQEQRYNYKHQNAYKDKFLHQDKTPEAVITLFNVFPYEIRDEGTSVGEGFEYYIIDLAVETPTAHAFPIAAFTRSCHLTTSDPTYRFSNVSYALKMYSLQSDSSELDVSYIQKFYQDTMPGKEIYRAKLFAYEVSKDEKDALFFHYTVGSQKFEVKVRDKLL
jgi:hypothetical protein